MRFVCRSVVGYRRNSRKWKAGPERTGRRSGPPRARTRPRSQDNGLRAQPHRLARPGRPGRAGWPEGPGEEGAQVVPRVGGSRSGSQTAAAGDRQAAAFYPRRYGPRDVAGVRSRLSPCAVKAPSLAFTSNQVTLVARVGPTRPFPLAQDGVKGQGQSACFARPRLGSKVVGSLLESIAQDLAKATAIVSGASPPLTARPYAVIHAPGLFPAAYLEGARHILRGPSI